MGWVDIFFPKKCLGCGSFGVYICSDCVNKLLVVNYQKCPECERRSIKGKTHQGCKSAWGMDGLVGGFRFRGVMRKMIGKYKFSYVTDLLDDLTEAMISFGDLEILVERKFSLVTGVPLHKSRLKERGYNQAELIAERMAKYFQIPFEKEILKRVKKTKAQAGLVRSERLENIKGAFELVEEVKGKRVLLVDDVWTTGSTMRECSRILKKNGAREVWGLVLAM